MRETLHSHFKQDRLKIPSHTPPLLHVEAGEACVYVEAGEACEALHGHSKLVLHQLLLQHRPSRG